MTFDTPRPSRTLVALGVGLALNAWAQTPPEPAPPPAPAKDTSTLQPVVVKAATPDTYTVRETSSATRLTLSPRETPQSLTVMTRERLEDQNLTSLRQVLDSTPGVYSYGYDTERVLFTARGFVVDTLMLDGVPTHTNFSTGSIDETLDTALYERIEIVRGATGLMTGAGNPAASINLVRKHADSKALAVSGSLTAGSWNSVRAEVDASTPLNADGTVRARFVAAGEDGDSYQDLYHKRKAVLYGVIDADLTPSTRVSVGADYQRNRPTGSTWGSFPLFLSDGSPANWSRSVTTATDWTFWERETQTVFGEVKHTFDNGWAVKGSLSHRRYEEDLALFYMVGFPDPVDGTGLDASAYRSKAKIIETALDLHASRAFELLGRKHEVVLGYNGSREKNTGTEEATVDYPLPPPGNFFQWNGSYAEPAWTESTPVNDIRTNQDAVYAAARFSLADSLKLITGARWGRWKIDSKYIYDFDNPDGARYDYNKVIPYAGLVWDFAPQFSAFTSYSGIFKPQAKRNASGGFLDPMEGSSVELGVKGEHFDRTLNTSVTVFETRQDNVAGPARDANGVIIKLPDGTDASAAVDGTRTRGFEVEIAGRLTNEVRASVGWTRYLTKDGEGQYIRTFTPPTMVRLFGTWEPRLLVPGLTLGGGVNWQSASSTTVAYPGDTTTTLRQGSVALVSAMARYDITPTVSVQFNANNLFDRRYYVLDEYDNTYYGAPANYSLALRVAY